MSTKRQELVAKRRTLATERRQNGIALADITLAVEPTEEQVTERGRLIARNADIDREILAADAALATMPEERFTQDAEGRELATLTTRARDTAIVSIAAMQNDHKSDHGNGALGEYQDHAKLDRNMFPAEFLHDPAPIHAAAGLTSAPTNVGTNEAMIETPVFADGDAAFMGVAQPIVNAMDAVFPDIATRPTVEGPLTDDTDVAETALTVNAELLAPQRGQASVTGLTTQMLRMPSLEDGIRATLRGGLAEWFDAQCITELLTVARVNAAATAETFATYVKRLVYDNVEGRYARAEGDLAVLVGTATLGHMAAAYRANETEAQAAEYVRSLTRGVRASIHIPAVASNRQDTLVALGTGRRNAVCPIWQGIEITVDRVTGAGKGQVEVFAQMFAAFSVSRAAGFKRVQVRHAA